MQVNSDSLTDELLEIFDPETGPDFQPSDAERVSAGDLLAVGDDVRKTNGPAIDPANGSAGIVTTVVTDRSRFDYNSIQGVSSNHFVNARFISRVEEVAARLGTRAEYILAVMSFETGGTFNPAIRSGIGATGLIRFLPLTARLLGTTTDALAAMTTVEQLEYVEKYFDQPQFRGRLGSLEGLYTAVLSGAARSDPNDVLFARGTRAYDLNPLDWNGDGHITAGEAVTPVAAQLYGGIAAVQKRLIELGFVKEDEKDGFASGKWGKNTAEAVAGFQRAEKLPATGLLDETTGRALFNSVGKSSVNDGTEAVRPARGALAGKATEKPSKDPAAAPLGEIVYRAATGGRHYTTAQGIFLTETLRPLLEELAGAYFQRTGRKLHVTSGYHPPERQASAMFDLIAGRGEIYVRTLFRDKKAVNDILSAFRDHPANRREAIAAMTRRIETQVSRGVYISGNLRSRAMDLSLSTHLGVLREIVDRMGGKVFDEGDRYHIRL